MIDVYIIGARGYLKKYGGWETLVHGLIDNQIDKSIKYHVFEIVASKEEVGALNIDNIECIRIYEKAKGGFQMIFADIKAFSYVKKEVIKNKIPNPVVLYLGARIGPIQWLCQNSFRRRGIVVLENPAGLEWKRPKWGIIGSLYQYISCYFTAISSDYIVCDCEAMRKVYDKMVKHSRHPKEFIAYGSYPANALEAKMPPIVDDFFKKHSIIPNQYFLIINRFMPENSWELILKEYMKSNTKKDFVIISNIDKESKYYNKLKKKLKFDTDKRIKFVGTTYDKDILSYVRQNAYGYFNGHTVGGTNPGLLEAMSTTGFVLARDCVFAREVCAECAIYFDDTDENSLSKAIYLSENLKEDEIAQIKEKAKNRIKELYNWNDVAFKYEQLFYKAIEERK